MEELINSSTFISYTTVPDLETTTANWDHIEINRTIVERHKHAVFLIGMAFLGGFVAGVILHCLYSFLIRYCLAQLEEADMPDGVINLSFIGDDSRPPHDDHPPDYATVMGQSAENDTTSRNRRALAFLRTFSCKKYKKVENIPVEESPPSYSSVLANLENDLNSR